MKEPKPFYPPLLALFPLLVLWSSNLSLIPMYYVLRPALVMLGVSVGLWLVSTLIWRDSRRGALFSTLIYLFAFVYHNVPTYLSRSNEDMLVLIGWFVSVIVIAGILTWRFRLTRILNVLGSFLLLAGVGQIAYGYATVKTPKDAPQNSNFNDKRPDPKPGLPDVYYIILDGYGRTDAVKRVMGYDNSWFTGDLEKKGFYVAKEARSNYCQTELSLSSSLNIKYMQDLLPGIDPNYMDRRPLDSLIGDNKMVREFRSRGYDFVSVTTGFPPVNFPRSDYRMSGDLGLNMLEEALVQLTPLIARKQVVLSLYEQRRQDLLAAFSALKQIPRLSGQRPRFTIAHILAPHPPFVFDINGNSLPQHIPYGFWDGSDYTTRPGGKQEYHDRWPGQADYISHQMVPVVDELLKSKRPKIVIIQGDHGSKLNLDQNSLQNTDLKECFPNLNAYYVPDDIRQKLYPKITPVNSFRLVLNSLFGTSYGLLEDRSWYSTFPHPYDYTDVTKTINSIVVPPVETPAATSSTSLPAKGP